MHAVDCTGICTGFGLNVMFNALCAGAEVVVVDVDVDVVVELVVDDPIVLVLVVVVPGTVVVVLVDPAVVVLVEPAVEVVVLPTVDVVDDEDVVVDDVEVDVVALTAVGTTAFGPTRPPVATWNSVLKDVTPPPPANRSRTVVSIVGAGRVSSKKPSTACDAPPTVRPPAVMNTRSKGTEPRRPYAFSLPDEGVPLGGVTVDVGPPAAGGGGVPEC